MELLSGQLAGLCCRGIKTGLPTANREVVYAVADRFRGRGYPTQATTATVEYLPSQTAVTAVSGVAHDGNAASERVLEKRGIRLGGTLGIDEAPHHHGQRSRCVGP